MNFRNWFKPSAVETLQAQLIEDLKFDNQALRQEIAQLNDFHRREMAEWRDAFAAIQFQSAPSNQPSLLDEMQEPDEETTTYKNFFSEFSRVHGQDNADIVNQEPSNG